MSHIAGLLARMQRAGVQLWLEGERLKFRAPKGALDAETKAELSAHKAEIIAFLASHRRREEDRIPSLVPAPRDVPRPLSLAQQRLWFLFQMEPESAVYNLPSAIRIVGPVDVALLNGAFNRLIARHEVLRTNFRDTDQGPVQVARPHVEIAIPVEDLSELDPERRDAEARDRIEAEGRKPFDILEEPLIRVRLYKCDDRDHILFFNLHHIVSDFWSIKLLFQELADAYRSLEKGTPMLTPEPEVQYGDFALWQRGWLDEARLARLVSFWREALEGAPLFLELPYDRPRPPVQSIRGDHKRMVISPAQTERLAALAKARNASLYMANLALFQVLLRWFSGTRDFLVGSDVANRNHPGMERLQGFFVNQLVLRAQIEDELPFAQYLERVRAFTLAANQHQDLPFDKLVEALNPKRANYAPVFQTKFIFQNVPDHQVADPGETRFEVFEPDRGTAQVDLLLVLSQTGEGLQGMLEYCTDLFLDSTATRLAAHYLSLVEAVGDRPDTPIETLLARLTERDKDLRKQRRPSFKKPGFKSGGGRFGKKPAVVRQG
ncbi:Condensation domain-containing protein [Sulfidibacter corallicola]|uniref:Condensation domain-containing protein n=1 Tax=Sulfidibacter corallicola TaxID=2818388 RepID=A0A8A4THS6_SULCO|nr:condensation domain-containing protein [Sulfidibacter corallicola]QTD48371.1 hypothetical protein J3U87_22555 [Sulfidibacter corallicola]